jgi:2-keto-4-pentenoate hydratase/2-oxohepta-3-ene-1,7-dioic acid hydratase in catechol pathway
LKKVNYLHGGEVHAGTLDVDRGTVQSCDQQTSISIAQIRFLPPVLKPGKIICVGLNYPPVSRDAGWLPPPYPVLFQKPASSLIGSGWAIVLPRISRQVLYEGELAVVIGARGKNVPLESALDIVAGYTIANDLGAADIEARSSQWASGKMFDTFCPLGPALVTPDELPNPGNISIQTRLNNEIVQDGNTCEMIFDVPYLIHYISQLTTLEPNDVILTGSPKRAGDSPDPRTPLRPGDSVSIGIEGLDYLTNPVVAEEDEHG